jgi:hypothetical protein
MVFMHSDGHFHMPNFTWFEPLQYKRVEMAVVRAPSQAAIVAHTHVRRRFPSFRPRFDVFSGKTCSADNAHTALLCARANTLISFCVYTVAAKVAEYMNQKCYSFRCLCVPARYQLRVGDTTLPYAACIVYPPCLYLYDRRCD